MTSRHSSNFDPGTVAGFGSEWSHYDQQSLSADERAALFDRYFSIFPFEALPVDAEGFDLGCGSGRWAALMALRVGHLHCIDPAAEALAVARRQLASRDNASFHHADANAMPLADGSQDFGYSLGVLHHVPDTAAAMRAAVAKLKPGAPFLVYIYYALDGRPWWFRAIWRLTDPVRRVVALLPFRPRLLASRVLAAVVYWPLARMSRLLERVGFDVSGIPLSAYRTCSFYTMRTDALDRFGTRLEKRFSRDEIRRMMEQAGLRNVRFREDAPYWVACGERAPSP